MTKKVSTLLLVCFCLNSLLYAKDYKVFFIKKEFDMGIPGKSLEKDYYINMGADQGVIEGSLLNVYRTVSILDTEDKENKTIDTKIVIGQLKAIYVQNDLTIARVIWVADFNSSPVANFRSVMIGDVVEVGKRKEPNKTASIQTTNPKS